MGRVSGAGYRTSYEFYQAVFELPASEARDDGIRRTSVLFHGSETGHPGISLNQTDNFRPSADGTLVYLDAGKDLSGHLARVEPAGGQVVEPKALMDGAGYYAVVRDTEGNSFALYSTD